MTSTDVTRLLKASKKAYVGARAQQGRRLLDSDVNEGRLARADDFTRAIRDVAGVRGSRDDGFLPDLVPGQVVQSSLVRFGASVQAFVLNYDLKPGSMQLGGWRVEQPVTTSTVFQREFLQMGPTAVPLAQVGTQQQLSILRVWEQPVSATEDSELFEPAMHGADGAMRVRRMRRVETRTVEAEDCDTAFEEVLETLGNGDTATYDEDTGVLQSNARLQLTFGNEPPGACPGCDPTLRGRYLGSEDHAIRLMLATSDTYVWAPDDSAPIYRAKVIFDGSGAQIEMLTPPKDSFHEPKTDRVVELLPWSALLENGQPTGGKGFDQPLSNEKVAARVGIFGTVDVPFNAMDRTFHARLDTDALTALGVVSPKKGTQSSEEAAQKAVKTGVPPGQEVVALEWDPGHPHASELNPGSDADGADVGYVYLRFWQQKRPGEGVGIPLNAGLPLGRTGVVPTFSGSGRRGDFWRATLRRAEPDRILPWEIMAPGGQPPDGPIEVIAPLALVEWQSFFGQNHTVVRVEDCRPNLPAITNRGCCTRVVGHGAGTRYATVQAAIDSLPASGGRICVREGVFDGAVTVSGRSNVIIEGCGGRTILRSSGGASELVRLESLNGGSVTLRNLTLEASGQVAVDMVGRGVHLKDLTIQCTRGDETPVLMAVRALDVSGSSVRSCHIRTSAHPSEHAAIAVRSGGDVLIEDNDITHSGDGMDRCWGGIHVLGGSTGLELRGNRITGALGHGITVGSVQWRATDGSDLGIVGPGRGQTFPESAVIFPTMRPNPVTVNDLDYFPEPDVAVSDLLIDDNDIQECSGSGIGALASRIVHGDIARRAPLCMRRETFVVSGTIRGNRIENNARGRGVGDNDRPRGGITLSEVQSLWIEDNVITGPVRNSDSGARCGMFASFGTHLTLRHNQITLSGDAGTAALDMSGGLVFTTQVAGQLLEIIGQEPALTHVRIEGNVVSSGFGPALSLMAGGACSVSNNKLETASPSFGGGPFGATTVAIVHPTRVAEAVDLPTGEPSPDRWIQPVGSQDFLSGRAQQIDVTGGVLIHNNQISTRLVAQQRESELVPVLLVSLGSLTLTNNQLNAQMPRGAMFTQAMVLGATVTATGNRLAENIESTDTSLIVTAPFLTSGTDNLLSHCPVVFGCENHQSDRYFAEEGNLTWFRLQEQSCEDLATNLHPSLTAFCMALFGAGQVFNPGTGLATISRRRGP